jgi:LysR family nitrogen assimilation transcriptional regulator
MDFRKLRNFVQIVELSSITAAADYLNIAQSALSRQVKALEDELNVPLLRRNGRGVVPTEAGIHLAQRAKVILVDIEALVAEISGNPKCLSGIVTLGLSPTVAEILGPHLVERTLETFPEIKLRMVSGLSHQIQDWLLRGTIDLGITYAGHKSPSINARLIMKEQLFLVQPPNGECHELCVSGPAHAGFRYGHALKRSSNMIAN